MLPVLIRFIPHKEQAYDTVGDYGESFTLLKGEKRRRRFLWFKVSKMKDWRYEFLVVIHELVEWAFVRHAGIKISEIDAFDKEMEENRKRHSVGGETYVHFTKKGELLPCFGITCKIHTGVTNSDEPGICARAPYHDQHIFAMDIEKIIAKALGVNWVIYNNAVTSL